MISLAMKAVADDLNASFRRQRNDTRDRVIVSNFLDQQGQPVGEGDDKIYFLLTQIREEKNAVPGIREDRSPAARAQLSEPIHLNLDVMFAAFYARYEVGLEVLSEVISYLHEKPVFNSMNTPALDSGINCLVLNLLKLDYAQQSHVWGCLGAKYVPSVMYSLRMLSIGGGRIQTIPASVTQPLVAGNSKADATRR